MYEWIDGQMDESPQIILSIRKEIFCYYYFLSLIRSFPIFFTNLRPPALTAYLIEKHLV